MCVCVCVCISVSVFCNMNNSWVSFAYNEKKILEMLSVREREREREGERERESNLVHFVYVIFSKCVVDKIANTHSCPSNFCFLSRTMKRFFVSSCHILPLYTSISVYLKSFSTSFKAKSYLGLSFKNDFLSIKSFIIICGLLVFIFISEYIVKPHKIFIIFLSSKSPAVCSKRMWRCIRYLSQDGSLFYARVMSGQSGTWSLTK